MRDGIPATRCLTGPQVSAPSATKKSSAPKTATEKTSTSTSPKSAELAKDDGEGVHEDDLDVEDHEDHRDQVEANRKALRRLDLGHDPALVGCQFRVGRALVRRRASPRRRSEPAREEHSENEQPKY